MGYRVILLALVIGLGAVLAGCGKEIGDACAFASDCSPDGDRICIDPTEGHGGYCTVQGCDYSTCPDEAACIRFFTGEFVNRECDRDPANPTDPDHPKGSCTLDELCSLEERCVPRSSEVRFCMRSCDSDGDCRDGYECRDLDKMRAHGGEPVLPPGTPLDNEHAPKFCAVAPSTN